MTAGGQPEDRQQHARLPEALAAYEATSVEVTGPWSLSRESRTRRVLLDDRVMVRAAW